MDEHDFTFNLNGRQLPARVTERPDRIHTFYDIEFENETITIFKDTLYTWTSDDPHGYSAADIQDLGEQLNTDE